MAKQVYEWFRTAAQNNFPFADGGMPEGMDRQQVNDSGREQMRAIREMYDTQLTSTVGMEYLDLMRNPSDGTAFTVTRLNATTVRIASGATDMSGYFNVDRRFQTYTAGAVTDALFVLSASYANPNTDVTINSAAGEAVTAGIDEVRLHASATIGRLAFIDTVSLPFVIPSGLTNAEFDAALATIDAAGGGILLLLGGVHLLDTIKTIDHPIWILGRGTGYSEIKVDDGADLAHLFNITSLTAEHVRFSNFTLNGNRANQAGGVGDGINIETRASQIVLEDLEIISTRRHGVYVDNDSATSDIHDVKLARIHTRDTGGDGIGSADPQSAMYAIQAEQITVDTPGQEQTESAAIRVAGQWNLSDITITGLDLGGGNTQRGIWFLERLAIDPNPQDAHLCTLNGFAISGTGANARGIECHGERIPIGRGTISLAGAVSRGVLMGGTLGQQAPQHNSLDDVYIEDANIGVLLESSCSQIAIGSGVRTNGCATGMDIQGDSCEVRGARIQGGTTGLKVAAAASEVIVEDSLIDGQSGNGLEVASGATDTQIGGNTFRDIAGKGILNADASTVWWKKLNVFDNVTGFNIDENAGTEYAGTSRTVLIEGVNQLNFGTSHLAVTGMEGISLPVPPDGTRKFLVSALLGLVRTAGSISAHLKLGTTGDITDTSVFQTSWNLTVSTMANICPYGNDALVADPMDNSPVIVTPAANELITISVNEISGSGTSDIHGHGVDQGGIISRTMLQIDYLG